MSRIESRPLFVLFTLLCLFVLTQWSSSVYLPIVPKLVNIIDGHKQLITSSLSFFFLGYAVGQLFWGILSDFIGRYTTLLISLAMYILFEALISILGSGAVYFVILIALAGFSISANTSVGNALIKDRYQERAASIISYVGIAMACAPVVAPIIGTILYANFGWTSLFIFLSFSGVLLLILFAVCFRESGQPERTKLKSQRNHAGKHSSIWGMMKTPMSDLSFMSYAIILALIFGIFFSLLLVIPFMLENAGKFSAPQIGLVVFGVTLTYIIGAVANAFFIKRVGSSVMVRSGLSLIFLGGILFLLNSFFFAEMASSTNLVPAAIVMLGIGAALPAAKAGAMMAVKKNAGTAASMMKFIQTLGCVVLTKIASSCIDTNGIKDFLVALVIISAALFFFGLTTLKIKN